MILIVDDDKGNVENVAEMLQLEGYAVKTKNSGQAAIDALKTMNFGLIICDITMPGITGYNVLQAARELQPLTPFVFLTAKGTIADQLVGKKLGADDYLTKPFSMKELLDVVERLNKD